MKLIFTFLLSMSCSTALLAQWPNGSFESWGDTRCPDEWSCNGSEYTFEKLEAEAHDGLLAVQIKSKSSAKATDKATISNFIIPEYEGRKLILTGYLRAENIVGSAGLSLRLDKERKTLAIEEMAEYPLEGTTDWSRFSIELNYIDDIDNLVFGAYLKGQGILWVDDLHLTLDGVDITEARKKGSRKSTAYSDHEFDDESKIDFETLTLFQKQTLVVVGQVWGLLKYNHPAVADGLYNWDYELFRKLPAFLACTTLVERNDIITEWIASMGGFKTAKTLVLPEDAEVRMKADYKWVETSGFNDVVKGMMNDIINSKKSGNNFYVKYENFGAGNPVFINESPYENINLPDGGYRLLSLYRFWNAIQYFFPYRDQIGRDWNSVLVEYIDRVGLAQTEPEYKMAMLRLVAEIHDTHASYSGGSYSSITRRMGERMSAIETCFVNDSLVVNGFYNDEKGRKSGLAVGDIITKIDGKTVESLKSEKWPYISASNKETKLRGINLLRSNDTLLTIDYEHEGVKLKTTVPTYYNSDLYTWARYNRMDTCFRMLNDTVAYIVPQNLTPDYIDLIMIEAMDSKHMIIDLRCYPAHFPIYDFGKYLYPKPTPFFKATQTSLNFPGTFLYSAPMTVGEKNSDYYNGKIYILVNEYTQSSAEFHTMAWSAGENAIVIGSTTAGADGNVSELILPCGMITSFSGLGIYYPDNTNTQRVGVKIDIEVKPTIKGIKEGRDEVMEKALQSLR
jgi:hypothetical protein